MITSRTKVTFQAFYRLKHVMHFYQLSFLAFILFFSPGLFGQNGADLVTWKVKQIDLGKVVKGEKVKGEFTFTNLTSEDVEIDLVSTCECTEAAWTKGKIAPGDQGHINFIFDSALKDAEEPIDIDVYFLNQDAKTGNPYSTYLSYTFTFVK